MFWRTYIWAKSLSLTECGIELSTTSDEAAKLFDATVAQTVLMDTDKQGSCSVLVVPIVYMNSFERWAQLKMLYKQLSPADWWHRTILEGDDGGGPRLPHGESVPPRERNCKLDLYEPDLTLTYSHMHSTSLSSMGEPTQTRSRGRKCLS